MRGVMSMVMPPTSGSDAGLSSTRNFSVVHQCGEPSTPGPDLGDFDRAAPSKRLFVALAELGGRFLRPEVGVRLADQLGCLGAELPGPRVVAEDIAAVGASS